MNRKKIDVLALGAHPDDVELGCGGFLANAKKEGLSTGIIVLTKGDAGRSGDAEIRAKEAAEAAKILGVDYFKMLGLSDGLLTSDIKTRELVAKEFAKIKPSLVITHYSDEIHPDHVETHDIVNKASFLSQLKKFSHDAYPGPKQILYYSLNPKKIINPDLLIDISEVFEIKNRALAVHKSQASVITSLNALATIYGSLSGTQYAEGFKFKEPLIINKTMTLLR